MKILIVTQYFWPENFRINDLTLALKDRGHVVTILTGMPNYPTGRLFDGYSRGWWCHLHDSMDGVPIYRVPMFLRRQGRGWQLALNYLSFVIFGCLFAPWYFRNKQFDVIFVYEPSPFTVGIPAIVMRRLKKAPLLFWVQDLWPESLKAAGAVRSPRVLGWVGGMVRWIYRYCDRILVQSEAFVEPAIAAGAVRDRVRYYPNWAEPFYHPLAPSRVDLHGVDLLHGFKVMFAGNLGEAQSLETIVSAAGYLKAYSDIHWIIVGDGRRSSWMREEVECRNLGEKIVFLGSYPPERMPHFFALSDVLLVTLKGDEVFSQTVPCKVQSYMACGKPVVAALNGEGARVIDEAAAGLTVKAGDSEALADAVLQLYQMTENERELMGRRGRAYYETHFERDMLVLRAEGWMEELVMERLCGY